MGRTWYRAATLAAVASGGLLLMGMGARSTAVSPEKQLRVCADPNNLPFSNEKEQGFDNQIAQIVARDLGYQGVSYTWWPNRRGFIRNTLNMDKCDLVIGVPAGYDIVATTEPYYRSIYAFVYTKKSGLHIDSFDDPRLKKLQIGVPLIGDDYSNPPPAHALGARQIKGNIHGYTIYGNYAEESPPKDLIDAVAKGDIDVAVAWGPTAGYWAAKEPVDLEVTPVAEQKDSKTGLPMAYNVAMGVRHGDQKLLDEVNRAIEKHRDEFQRILKEYHVPTLPITKGSDLPGSGEESSSTEAPKKGSDVVLAADHRSTGTAARPIAAMVRADTSRQDSFQVTPTVYNGWKWFHVYCYRCHGVDAIGGQLAPDLRHSVRTAISQDSFMKVVTNGRLEKGMPSWKALLDPDQILDLYHYVKARSTGDLKPGRPERPKNMKAYEQQEKQDAAQTDSSSSS